MTKNRLQRSLNDNMTTNKLLVSIIIPSKDESREHFVLKLMEDISIQEINADVEIHKIRGISPPGKARNIGANKSQGEILVFFDDDIRLGNKYVLANLIQPLLDNKNTGITAGSIRIPEDAKMFEQRYAREIPTSYSPIVDKITDIWVATSACCAIRKDIFLRIGQFNEQILRGEDSEISNRMQKAGYRTVLIPQTFCYHHQPQNIQELIKMNFRNGRGSAFVDINYPQLNIDVNPKGVLYTSKKIGKFSRGSRFLSQLISAVIKCKFLFLLVKLVYIYGYLYEIIKCKIFKKRSNYL